MNEIILGDRPVGKGHPCYIIAEIGLNHNGRYDIAKKLVDICAEAGFDAVKTQKRDLRSLFRPGILDESEKADKGLQYLMPFLKKFELPDRDLLKLKAYTEAQGMDFICTPFDIASAEYLVKNIGITCLKVASADLVNISLLEEYIKYDLPMLISTGMSTEEEIETTYRFLKDRDAQFAFFHCNSNYPAPFAQINLNYMTKMMEIFDIPIGYSGHELGLAVSVAAVAMGATMLERHITLDRTMEGPDHAASLEPTGCIKMVRDIRNVETAMGRKARTLSRGEVMNRQALSKSLVAATDLAKGEKIDSDDVLVMSPGDGLSPQKIYDLIGINITRDMKKGSPFLVSDLGGGIAELLSNVPFPYGAIARWHDIQFILDNFSPQIIEVHMTAQDMEERPTLKDSVTQELVIHMPEHFGNLLVDLCARDEDHRKWSIEKVFESAKLTLEVAGLFRGTPNRPKMVVHPGAMSVDSFVDAKEIAKMRDALQTSLDELENIGVEIMLENLPPYPWYLGGQWFTNYTLSSDEMLEVLKDRELGITFDTSHSQLYCNWAGVDIVEEMEKIMPILRHLHVSDTSGIDGEGLQIGMGNIPWERLAPYLFAEKNVIMPEIWLGHLHGMAGMNEALYKLQQLYNKTIKKNNNNG